MKAFDLGVAGMIVRLYLMMMVVVIAGFTHQWWIAFLAFAIFLSTMLGLTFKRGKKG